MQLATHSAKSCPLHRSRPHWQKAKSPGTSLTGSCDFSAHPHLNCLSNRSHHRKGGSMTTIGLVACSKTKANQPLPASALYTSSLFRKAAAYCRHHYDCWFVLCACHGLVAPQTIL